MNNGGGHYRQVQKVRAFLDGYRRAQRTKQARITVVALLKNLFEDGIDRLDMALSTMSGGTGGGGGGSSYHHHLYRQ
jgi:pyruvate/oxaloacetate carboxyltransferase